MCNKKPSQKGATPLKKNQKEIKIWGSLEKYIPFTFSYISSKKYDHKHMSLLDQNIVIGAYDNVKKQFLKKNSVSEYFNNNTDNSAANIYNNLSKNIPEGFHLKPLEEKPSTKMEHFKFDKEDHYVTLYPEISGVKIQIMSNLLDNMDKFVYDYEEKIKRDARVYGEKLIYKGINRYILFPIRAYHNDKQYFLNISLEIFSNKSGILMIDIPMEERNSEEFYFYEIQKSFEKISIPECLLDNNSVGYDYVEVEEKNINEVINKYYLDYLFSYFGMDVYVDKGVESLLITQTNLSIKTLNTMNEELVEALYRILHRPVDSRVVVKDKLDKFKKDYWGNSQLRTYFSENGNSLSLTVSDFQVVPEEQGGKEVTRELVKFSLEHTLDIPLKIILLQRLNNQLLYKESTTDIRKVEIIKEHHLADRVYISNLLEDFYGTALDLVEYMKKSMRWYVNEEDITEKNANIHNLILSMKERRKKRLSGYLTIVGFVFTVIFALPTLRETFEIIIGIIYPHLDITIVQEHSKLLSFYSWIIIIVAQLIIGLCFNFEKIYDFFLYFINQTKRFGQKQWHNLRTFLSKNVTLKINSKDSFFD